VHRALLATRSSFFEGACRNSFLEAQTGVIDLSEDDAEAVEHMVHCKPGNDIHCACTWTNICRLLSYGLFEQATISPLITTLLAGKLAIYTLRSARRTEETESCAHGRSATGDHGGKQQFYAADAAPG
jgi:hypothetical protein